MEPISEDLVSDTWQEFAGFSTKQAQREMIKVSKNQPYLLAFMMEFTKEQEREVQELAIYMFYVLCRMFQKSAKRKIKKVPVVEIIDAYKENEQFFKSMEGSHEKFLERIAETHIFRQPYVMKHVVEALMEAPEEEDPIMLTEKDAGYLFLLLKTVVDLLDKRV